ncbi:MAG: 50S ribosomal protein L16 [Mycoplasma sp.]|nr:50S ribosomal protein L16 [Mycoplasma sp.]
MLQPKRTKYRRIHRIKHDTVAKRGKEVVFGEFGLKALTSAWVTNRQIESARIAITRKMGREGQVWIKIFPHMSKTAKPIGVRMGSGKGSPDSWVAVVRKEVIMFEVAGVPEEIAREALRLGMHKLPVQAKIVKRKVGK